MNREIKVVMLGESGVGKSSIVLRFSQNEFKTTLDSTMGAVFTQKSIEVQGITFKFQIWDTAGQEKYKSLTPLYYRDAQIALIVYDITNKDSFETLKSWVDELKEHGPKKIIQVLVGNKTDLIEQEKVQYDEAISYAKQIGAVLKLTSCKENKGINEMFESIAENILTIDNDPQVIKREDRQINNQSVRLKNEDSNPKKQSSNDKGCC